ncbi:MAG TPA: uroporphyrinogen decarboxylase family protein [Anaerolineae bacterium]|nr:uroporphyrinogen decarboxylase family protein [Anaerolineae bacterium]
MADKPNQELYDARLKRILDASALKVPDRVPVLGPYQKYPYGFAGVSFKDAMNDYAVAREACHKFLDYFQPDADFGPIFAYPAKAMELFGWKAFKWPGHGLGDDVMYQYVDGEYMTDEEYDEFIFDPSDFMLRKWAPRQFTSMEGFSQFVPWRRFMWSGWMNLGFWTSDEFQQTLRDITAGAEELNKWWGSQAQYWGEIGDKGYPLAFAGWDWAPFDILGDTLRGTRHILADMRRRPEKLHAALEVATKIFVEYGSGAAGAPLPFTWVWIHKSTRDFMSDSQFDEFYWHYLRKGLMALIDKGITPVIYWEADWESRMEHIRDVPAGKMVYHLSNTNYEKAKDVLGDRVCLMGNVPNITLLSGTPDDVRAYCKKMIDTFKDGGLIMDAALMLDEAKPENLKAMIDFTKEYGVYG